MLGWQPAHKVYFKIWLVHNPSIQHVYVHYMQVNRAKPDVYTVYVYRAKGNNVFIRQRVLNDLLNIDFSAVAEKKRKLQIKYYTDAQRVLHD